MSWFLLILLQAETNADAGSDYWTEAVAASATVFAAVLAALVAVIIYVAGQKSLAKDRKRQTCSEALAAALEWLELPYRVRRRTGDDPATLSALTNRIHDLQDSLLKHSSWLRVESEDLYAKYTGLVTAVKSATREVIQKSWEADPISSPSGMNIGELPIDRSEVESKLAIFTAAVREAFG